MEQIFDFMLSRIYSQSIERLLQMFEVEKLFWLSGERGFGRHSKQVIPQMHLQIALRLFLLLFLCRNSSCDNGQWL